MIKIRKATSRDVDILAEFWYKEEEEHKKFDKLVKLRKDARIRIHNYIGRSIRNKNFAAFVAEDNKKPVGAIQGWIGEPYFTFDRKVDGHCGTAFVDSKYRRRRILKILYKNIISWFKSKNVDVVSLYVYKNNKISRKVFKNLGFKESMIFMNKKLR
jgi:ribosomal protein S18 acetylase RimI-like enzyme